MTAAGGASRWRVSVPEFGLFDAPKNIALEIIREFQLLFAESNSSIQAVLERNGILKPFQNPALEKARECRQTLTSKQFVWRSRNEIAAMSQAQFNDYKDMRDEFERLVKSFQEANLMALQTMQDQCNQYAMLAQRKHTSKVAKGAVIGAILGGVLGGSLTSMLFGGTLACAVTGILEYDSYTRNIVWLEEQTAKIVYELQKNDLDIKDKQVYIDQWHKVRDEFYNKQKEIVRGS